MPDTPAVSELRLVVTTADYDAALRFYRDVLGLGQRAAFASPDGGQVAILEAGRATLELSNPRNAAYIDEVEVGRRVAGPIRVAFEVADSPAAARALEAAGATVIAAPTRTPWNSVNARLAAPADLQLTLFSGPADGADEAAALARDAADRQGLRIAELRELADLNEAAALLQAIWRADTPDQVVSADLMRALASSGNYVVGAFRGDKLVAATVAFFGAGHLHSHVTGVDPAAQRGGVGYALKQHQRAWALARRITEVRWTFDPLVRRNAYFNLHKLGALPVEYLTEFYGEMTDGINLGDASDRLYVGWQLGSPRAQAAAHGEPGDVDATALRAAGACVLVDRVGELPRPADRELPADGRALLVAVPGDIEALRRADPTTAKIWRYAVREALTGALGAGYRITGMSRDGFYVLEAKP